MIKYIVRISLFLNEDIHKSYVELFDYLKKFKEAFKQEAPDYLLYEYHFKEEEWKLFDIKYASLLISAYDTITICNVSSDSYFNYLK